MHRERVHLRRPERDHAAHEPGAGTARARARLPPRLCPITVTGPPVPLGEPLEPLGQPVERLAGAVDVRPRPGGLRAPARAAQPGGHDGERSVAGEEARDEEHPAPVAARHALAPQAPDRAGSAASSSPVRPSRHRGGKTSGRGAGRAAMRKPYCAALIASKTWRASGAAERHRVVVAPAHVQAPAVQLHPGPPGRRAEHHLLERGHVDHAEDMDSGVGGDHGVQRLAAPEPAASRRARSRPTASGQPRGPPRRGAPRARRRRAAPGGGRSGP